MLSSLIPVLFCIALGWIVARIGWVRDAAIKDLSNLVFLVLTPALLFRTMGQVRLQELDFRPVVLYFAAVAILFIGTLLLRGFSKRAAAEALSKITIADLLAEDPPSLRGFALHASCPVAA